MATKTRLAAMTWKEAEEAFKENPVIIVPNASIEQHGPQTPVGDFRVGEVVADRIAERTGAIVAPMLAYGYSEVFRRFPGTVTLRPSTVHDVMYDVVSCFLDQGLDHVMFLCCHNGNMAILDHVAREIRRERGVVLGCLEPWRLFSSDFFADVYQQPNPRHGHGSEPFTSLSLHLFPDDVRMDLAEAENRADFGNLPLRGVNQIQIGDVTGQIYFDYLDVVPNGVLGDVNLGSSETGAKLLDRVVELGAEYVELFRGIETRR
jgi:creatinine amidohydrolase